MARQGAPQAQSSHQQTQATSGSGTPAKGARGRPGKQRGIPASAGLAAGNENINNPASIPQGTSMSNQTPRQDLPAPLAPNQTINTIQEKDAEIARLQALLAAKESAGPGPVISSNLAAIPKPKGEAGDKRKGFVLQDAMELSGSSEKEALYRSILRTTRRNIIRANLDLDEGYKKQDHEKLSQVFKLTRNEQPYLSKKRFPADWALVEIVKQYLRNQRKETKRKLKAAQDHGPARKRTRRHIDDANDSNDEDIDPLNPSGSGSDDE
ncbi:hypothetical protein DXG03_008288 [Asterophora parasitica]|uniref:Uncharacterized protein n=1 Tax=Asterophora parasitica TaxID=117018 RepID=A0A9P7K925_9AGAR|nr:hypothetical protein DXG03_008288 [Asterophora parasitica]